MNNDINEKIVHAAPVPPFVRFVASAVPMVFDNSLSYYEALCALWKWIQDDVIDVINNNATVTEHYIELDEETRQLFIELKSYVDNYFDNLDVQEEINNKLDEMAESGQLTDIIAQYLGLAGVLAFGTVADMKAAENLVNGSTCRTTGYHDINDGGDALYRVREVTNEDVVDEAILIALHDNQLVAELIIGDRVHAKQFGAKGDNETDDTESLQSAINYVQEKNGVLLLDNGIYKITQPLTITKSFVLKGIYSKGETTSGYLGSEIVQSTENTNLINFTTNSIYNMQIKDIRLKGNGGRGLNVDGIFFSEFTFDNIILNGGFTDAIYLDQATIGNISNCAIASNNGGMNLNNASGIIFINNNFWLNANYGIKFGAVSGCYFIRNYFENTNARQYPNLLFQAPVGVSKCIFELCGFINSGKENIKIDYITNITERCRLVDTRFLNCNFQSSSECAILINNDDGNGNRNSNATSYTGNVQFDNCTFNYIQSYCVKTDYNNIFWLFKNCNVYSNFGYGNQALTNSLANLRISSMSENNAGISTNSTFQLDNIANAILVRKNSLYLDSNTLKWRNNDNNKSDSVALILKGTTTNRPSSPEYGTMYFDSTLGKPIWFNHNAQWVDSTGTLV